jgi:tetratricopeptide (TPR) repeat protein
VLALTLGATGAANAQGPRNEADAAWRRGDVRGAAVLYLEQVRAGAGGDTSFLNFGTAALALGDADPARGALERAARSIEPEVRFRALYNLGLLALRLAERDTVNAVSHLEEAQGRYREALLLQPGDAAAKWNLELALRRMPEQSGAASGQGGGGESDPEPPEPQGLSPAQAEQILNSISAEERRTLQRLNRRRAQVRETRGRRDW